MTAYQRSNVTTRQERGIGPVSFKRVLLSGGTAAILAMLLGRFAGPLGSCLGGAFVLATLVVMTQPREGMSTFSYLLQSLRGWLTLLAVRGQLSGALGWLARLMLVNPRDGAASADQLFGSAAQPADTALNDPFTFLDSDPQEPGLIILSGPGDLTPTYRQYPATTGFGSEGLTPVHQRHPAERT
jgi:hypothetical protein